MPTEIDRHEVRRLVGAGAQLIDVLPAEEYAEEHIPGAANLPLEQLNRATTASLRRDAPVVVYCHNHR